jgi:hypothetical protein
MHGKVELTVEMVRGEHERAKNNSYLSAMKFLSILK